MSWGERSCKHYGTCPIPKECTAEYCNVDCRYYGYNGNTKPDSESKMVKEIRTGIKAVRKSLFAVSKPKQKHDRWGKRYFNEKKI